MVKNYECPNCGKEVDKIGLCDRCQEVAVVQKAAEAKPKRPTKKKKPTKKKGE